MIKINSLSLILKKNDVKKDLKKEKQFIRSMKQIKQTYSILDCPDCKKELRWAYSLTEYSVYLQCDCRFFVELSNKNIWSISKAKWCISESSSNSPLDIKKWKNAFDLSTFNLSTYEKTNRTKIMPIIMSFILVGLFLVLGVLYTYARYNYL